MTPALTREIDERHTAIANEASLIAITAQGADYLGADFGAGPHAEIIRERLGRMAAMFGLRLVAADLASMDSERTER